MRTRGPSLCTNWNIVVEATWNVEIFLRESRQEASRSHTGRTAYIMWPHIDYCLWEAGPLWGEELGNWPTCTQTHTQWVISTEQWWVGENGIATMTLALPPCEQRSLCARRCVCASTCVCRFPPHRIHLKIPRLLHWWKLLPFILTVSASGGQGGSMGMRGEKENKRAGMMWAGVQINARFVTACVCLSGHLTVHVGSEIILPSIYRQNKKEESKLKTPPCAAHMAISNCEPIMTCITSQRSSGYPRLHAMRNPYGHVLFLHRRRALARHIFSCLRPGSIVCLLLKGPSTQLCHRAPPKWDLYLQTQTPGVGDASSVFAVNFTSLGFVGLVYYMGKCEINPVFTSLVLCTRRRKLEPGLTICGIIKTVFVPPWLTLCLPLCFPLFFLFGLILLPPPSPCRTQSPLQSQRSALICSLV